jgi:hydrogenase-4 component F
LEATTICAAGIIYHRRSPETLEATWKYIFVCSTGIAMAYLGVLILSSAAHEGSLSYESLREAVEHCNPLYLKIAFLLVLAGYSCKMEIFPLYTIGIDANFAAPAPAASLISTVLVNAGFVAVLRVYRLMAESSVFEWVQNVLIVAGVVSLLIGALFLRRTNNYKRFLSYSTVENMGIAAIGLGIGGVAAWAAVLHVAAHTLIKSSMFLQIGVVRSIYDGYRINRLGDYMNLNRVGAAGLIIGAVALLAFPPSPLFVSELMILRQTMAEGQWWLVAVIFLLLCIVIYSIFSRVIKLCYQPNQSPTREAPHATWLSWSAIVLLGAALVIGLTLPEWLKVWIDQIVNF